MSTASEERATAWIAYMRAAKASSLSGAPETPETKYERLRERYATGSIRLGDFEAEVSILLSEGL